MRHDTGGALSPSAPHHPPGGRASSRALTPSPPACSLQSPAFSPQPFPAFLISKFHPWLKDPRLAWIAVAAAILSRPRIGQCGPLTGCQLFVKVNVHLAHRGQPQLDLPPLALRCTRPAVPSPCDTSCFPQLPLACTLYLQATRRLADWPRDRHKPRVLLPARA